MISQFSHTNIPEIPAYLQGQYQRREREMTGGKEVWALQLKDSHGKDNATEEKTKKEIISVL